MTEYGAEEHLRAIRLLMERATVYRAISSPTALVGGVLSLVVSLAMLVWQTGDQGRNVDSSLFYVAWSFVFVATLAANTFFIWQGAQQRGELLISPGMKVALRSLLPSVFAGATISAALVMTSEQAFVPVLFWLVFTGWRYSRR